MSSIQETLKSLLEGALSPSPLVLYLGIAFALLFPVILHFVLGQSSQYVSLPSILLAGPSGGGKTSLLTHLERRGNHVTTHLTQLPHSVELSISNPNKGDSPVSYKEDLDKLGAEATKFLVQDTPGHGKLRGAALRRIQGGTSGGEQNKVKGVVFVVDASALSEADALADTAGYLYDVLISLQKRMGGGKGSRAPRSIPVLIAANKMDLFTAITAQQVKAALEAELGRIRSTRSRGLLDSGVGTDDLGDDKEEGDSWLGQYGSEKFKFEQMAEFDTEVEVVGGNVEGKGPGVDKWWEWIAEQI